MASRHKYVAASEFKAKCLALLDEVAETGMSLIVTKRGKPVVQLLPLDDSEPPDLLGSVRYEHENDLLAPIDDPWEADQ